jgi:hypothetical protein
LFFSFLGGVEGSLRLVFGHYPALHSFGGGESLGICAVLRSGMISRFGFVGIILLRSARQASRRN